MNSDQLQELPFKVVHSSSEDVLNPANNLTSVSYLVKVDNRAWHSARNCVFPQEIVLRLEQKSRVQSIIVGSHSKFISQAIEVTTINLYLCRLWLIKNEQIYHDDEDPFMAATSKASPYLLSESPHILLYFDADQARLQFHLIQYGSL